MEKECIFKIGDRVFDIQFGWGTVVNLNKDSSYSIEVKFDFFHQEVAYSLDGKYQLYMTTPTLSFTEYSFNNFTQKRQPVFKVNDRVFDINYGWGKITCIRADVEDDYPVEVKFENDEEDCYTLEGMSNISYPRFLSFTEYNLETGGFSQDRKDIYNNNQIE